MGAQGTSRRACRSLLVGLLGVGLSGCIYLAPPNTAFRSPVVTTAPSTPADGYRHTKRGSPDMIYDSRLGLYVVLGYRDHFHDGKRYYRCATHWYEKAYVGGKAQYVTVTPPY